jgi:hypothetical protein
MVTVAADHLPGTAGDIGSKRLDPGAPTTNGHVRPWRHRGFPGGTPLPDQHLGVLLEDRRFLESQVVHGVSGRVSGRCLPYDVSAESFEETDTARNPAFDRRHGHKELCWDRMGAT